MHLFTKTARRAAAAACGLLAVAALPAVPAHAATAAGAPAIPGRYAHQKLDWRPCDSGPLECASMSVPRDWYHPGRGPDLTIAVSRHRAADPAARRGVLMMAAGGPGASGLGRPAGLAAYAPKLAAAYDIVSFDQRGVGASTNVVCSGQEKVDALFGGGDLRDRSEEAVRATVERARDFVRDCRRNSGGLLPHITTDQAVHDMDLYRALLGTDKVSYYGPSYATFLGGYYATRFPHRVERVVLDSNIDFGGSWQDFLTGQPMSFQRRFEQDFLPWLAANDATYHRGRTPEEAKASYERLRASLRERPLDLEGTRVTPDHLDAATTSIIYNGDRFPDLAMLLGVLEDPGSAPPATRRALAQKLKHPMAAGFAADFFSVICSDTPWNRDSGYWVRRSEADSRAYPLAGARELTFTSICAAWPRSRAPRVEVTGKGLPPVLMLNSTHDPATYYEGAVRAHQRLAGSRLITVRGGDHGAYQAKNACVDRYVEEFLLDGRLPAADAACEGKPLPDPAAAGPQAAEPLSTTRSVPTTEPAADDAR
ncbi:alpha/beta hydrolase [Streptomyces sp. NBC_00091]|uniref:alpha/beta hydrolase n=1 Tax=Streptomyces sp. NBC_00091 TaxID=2975648 RepID=UPI00224F9B0B|nr:alpha/beta hydrolase [Streptomyces sp. NBC_00091]MCX5380573.1 alpha/beta hydrolase [Streptomyces sp. NBC_00091]